MQTAIRSRQEKAVSLVLDNCVAQATMPHYYWVLDPTNSAVKYLVRARIDWEELPGSLLETRCTQYEQRGFNGPFDEVGPCYDWERQLEAINDILDQRGSPNQSYISQVDGLPLCEHVLAVVYFTGALAWPEWAPRLTIELPVSVPV
jgi:hypothetical protein